MRILGWRPGQAALSFPEASLRLLKDMGARRGIPMAVPGAARSTAAVQVLSPRGAALAMAADLAATPVSGVAVQARGELSNFGARATRQGALGTDPGRQAATGP